MGRSRKRLSDWERIFAIWLAMTVWGSVLIFLVWIIKIICNLLIGN